MGSDRQPPSGADRARAAVNKISKAFDRSSIKTTLSSTADGGTAGEPVTALVAAQRCLKEIGNVSQGFELKSVAAQSCPLGDGTSNHWSVSGVFPKRRASAWAEWSLEWDEAADQWGVATIEVHVEPFIVPGSVMDTMITQGKVVRDQIRATVGPPSGLRGPSLAVPFVDSDVVVQHARQAGLDPDIEEFHLQTMTAENQALCWQLTRRHADPLVFPIT